MKLSDNQAPAKVAQLARNMAAGYAAHIAAIRLAPRVSDKALVRLIADYPIDSVQRKDGTKWSFDMQDALISAVADEAIAEEFPRVWLTGSLLAVGDALKRNDYFDHAPELELVRHLRNGIAHGNRFAIQKLTYPAHNRDAALFGRRSPRPNRARRVSAFAAAHTEKEVVEFSGPASADKLCCSATWHLHHLPFVSNMHGLYKVIVGG